METQITVKDVAKKFTKSLKRSMAYGALDIFQSSLGFSIDSSQLRSGEFWALNNISFDVTKGETLGIIGCNGSGKSTLLKMLNGIFYPDQGSITMAGKVGALIEVGAGFHPMLSGRENIYINGAILGMTKKEIDAKFDEIVAFADIGDFLDAPVKHYSSGMYVRLGFAIAVNVEPEILLIDEVLSVGDLAFQNKSLQKLSALREKAHIVVFVSHNLEHVRNLCDKILVLNKGELVYYGDPHEAIKYYKDLSNESETTSIKRVDGWGLHMKHSSGEFNIIKGCLVDDQAKEIDSLIIGQDIIILIEFEVNQNLEDIIFSVAITEKRAFACIWQMSNDSNQNNVYHLKKGKYRLRVRYKSPQLAAGTYVPSVSIRNAKTGQLYEKLYGYLKPFQVKYKENDHIGHGGILHIDHEWHLHRQDG